MSKTNLVTNAVVATTLAVGAANAEQAKNPFDGLQPPPQPGHVELVKVQPTMLLAQSAQDSIRIVTAPAAQPVPPGALNAADEATLNAAAARFGTVHRKLIVAETVSNLIAKVEVAANSGTISMKRVVTHLGVEGAAHNLDNNPAVAGAIANHDKLRHSIDGLPNKKAQFDVIVPAVIKAEEALACALKSNADRGAHFSKIIGDPVFLRKATENLKKAEAGTDEYVEAKINALANPSSANQPHHKKTH